MYKLAQNIEQLLYQHECVIVPDFGGFVANYKSAEVNQLNGKFSPPSKRISFNKNLLNNDGLLANNIAVTEGITYTEALSVIKKEVSIIQQKLSTDKAVLLQNIGQLYIDQEKNLRFEPSNTVNYLIDAFGLSVFNLPKVVVEKEKPVAKNIEQKIEKIFPVVQFEPVVKELESENKSKNKEKQQTKIIPILKKVGYAAALIPFVAYLFWVPTKTELFKGGNFSYADLNPFTDKICAEYKVNTNQSSIELDFPLNEILNKINTSEEEVINISLFDADHKYYNENLKIPVRIKNSFAEVESTKVAVEKKEIYKFHIIAGCFKEYSNAEKLAEKLRIKGFSAAIIDKNNGLFRVAFQSFTNRNEAKKLLAVIKKEHNSSAWLLVK